MTADGGCCNAGIDGTVGEVVADLARSFPQAGRGLEVLDDPFDLNDGRDSVPPVRIGDDGGGGEHRGPTCFVPVAFLSVDGLKGRSGRSLGAAAFNLPAQGLLVRFQLDDQIGTSCRSYRESLFDSGSHRA